MHSSHEQWPSRKYNWEKQQQQQQQQRWAFIPLHPQPSRPLFLSRDDADVLMACCVSQYEQQQQQQQQQHLQTATQQLQHACLRSREVELLAQLALRPDAFVPVPGVAADLNSVLHEVAAQDFARYAMFDS